MRILIIGAYGSLHREVAIEMGFKNLGIEVASFQYGDILFNKSLISRVQFKIGIGPVYYDIEQGLKKKIEQFEPDILFFRRPLEFNKNALLRLKKVSSALFVSYNNDDPFSKRYNSLRWFYLRRAIPLFDIHFAFRRKNIEEYLFYGAKHVYLWEPYFVPWLHKKSEVYLNNNRLLFAMHAEKDNRRDALLNLLSNNLPVDIYCWNWAKIFGKKDLSYLKIQKPIWGSNYVSMVAQSMGTLCFFSKQNNDELTSRVFEIPACGGLLITEKTDRISELFSDMKDAVIFSSIDDLVKKCKILSMNPSLVIEIKKNSYLKIIEGGFSIIDRCKMAVEIFHQFKN
jgi:spore maturation protein CgeB